MFGNFNFQVNFCTGIILEQFERDNFHKPIQLMNHTQETSSKVLRTFGRLVYGRVGVFRIKMRLLVQKL